MRVSSLKSLTPRSLIGRTALILLVPIVTVQLVVSYVFIQRLYEDVTAQMTRSVLPSIDLILGRVADASDDDDVLAISAELANPLGFEVDLDGPIPAEDSRAFDDLSGRVVINVLRESLPELGSVDLLSNDRRVRFGLSLAERDIVLSFDRARASARNPHQLLVLMVFVSTVVTIVSFLFLKNQVRPIRRLARAAAAFGKGRVVPYSPSGATEVRQAGTAFLEMRDRIDRHIEQRTLMLSGVSHDLKTPLTRMKLGLNMLNDPEEAEPLLRDVDEMQRMLDTFLSFARGDATETAEPTDPFDLARTVVQRARSAGAEIDLRTTGEGHVTLRPMSMERALDNLVSNARRYGKTVRVSVDLLETALRFTVEDDGPGIPREQRDEATRPFTRLDPARNQDMGGSVGLGLSIVRDIARQHGGSLRLGESEDLGGLRVDMVLAR